jgi:hypothetical protein
MPGMLPEARRRRKLPPALAKTLDRLRHDSALRRRVFLGTTGAALIVVVLATILLMVIPLSSFKTTADRLTWAGDVLVGATLLLAAIAAVVALLAYAVSTGPPDIRLRVECPAGARPNNPSFEVGAEPSQLRWLGAMSWKILLKNVSGYPARNPALIIRFGNISVRHGINSFDATYFDRNWTVIDSVIHVLELWVDEWEGYKAIQWDGGSAYSIHGHSTRRLPDFDLGELRLIAADPSSANLTFEILADGYRKVISLPVTFWVDDAMRGSREHTMPDWI